MQKNTEAVPPKSSDDDQLIVDIVIAVHDARRPIARAVDSILAGAPDGVRVTVVCHGMSATAIKAQTDRFPRAGLRVFEFSDGIASPAGPFNFGLASATAAYVGVMGSDDYLAPGALRAWLTRVHAEQPDVLLAELRHQGGVSAANPPVRAWRRRRLDPIKDRLFYRSAPLGLIRRSALEKCGFLFTEGMSNGEDIALSTRLFSAGLRVDLARNDPHYVIGNDAVSRVTTTALNAADSLRPIEDLVERPWVAELRPQIRRSIAIKLIRVHLLSVLRARPLSDDWSEADINRYQSCLDAVLGLAPRVTEPLSRADQGLIEALQIHEMTADQMQHAITTHAAASRLDRIVPRNPLHLFDRESVLRRYFLYAIDPRGRKRLQTDSIAVTPDAQEGV